jgi:hypothetical protein
MFALAPIALIRAAAFPFELLRAFGDRSLGEFAVSSDEEGRKRFSDAYAHALARERTALWEATIGSPRFLKALELANPNVARRVEMFRRETASAKETRRLATTLYRYLARAIGRTEPCDLWAGVAFARWGERTRVVPFPERRAVAPNLLPFRRVVRALAKLPRYRAKCRYRPNPTLVRRADGSWIFWTWERRVLRPRRLKTHQPIDHILEQLLPLPPLAPNEIAAVLEAPGHVDVERRLGGRPRPAIFIPERVGCARSGRSRA